MSDDDSTPRPRPRRRTGGVIVVGPCAAGKSTLAASLQRIGFRARQIAQEHSYVPDMWLRISRPDFLVFLDARYETCTRRKNLDWTRQEYEEQERRLADAQARCNLYLRTDDLSPREVLEAVLYALREAGLPQDLRSQA